MQVETSSSLFTKVIQDHLELKERNSRLESSMPIGRYKDDDPFQNHPLFKTEEQARLEETMDGEGAEQLAERVRRRLKERVLVGPDGTPLIVTASFGVASFPEASSRDELVAQADRALYEAKRSGRDQTIATPLAP